LSSPEPIFGVLIKVGLSETLSFVDGFVYGPVIGFITGSLIIIISDLFTLPGPWTPFIAAIIGLIGFSAGIIRRAVDRPSIRFAAGSAVVLTLLSEFLQNAWVAVFYNVPIAASMITGIPSLITALANNVILFTTLGLKVINLLRKSILKP
jgi:uncharacterized membrane protein